MSIDMMVGKEEFEANAGNPAYRLLTDYPGHAVDTICHSTDYKASPWRECPHRNDPAFAKVKGPGCNAACDYYRPLYMRRSHVGLVLALGERNGYHDSDFYAVVWNPEKGCTEHVEYATTRGWTYPNNANEDATPEVVAAYEAWAAALEAKRRAAALAAKLKTPEKGKIVKVVKGRKVPVGLVGEVFWVGADNYKRNAIRVGIKLDNGEKVFTAGSNVEVIAQSRADLAEAA